MPGRSASVSCGETSLRPVARVVRVSEAPREKRVIRCAFFDPHFHRYGPMPRSISFRKVLAPLALLAMVAGCAHGRRPTSYLPVGASAWYGNRVADGVVVMLPLSREAARGTVARGLQAAGYEVQAGAGERDHIMQTAARPLAGDTTLAIAVQIVPVEGASGSSLILTGRYSVASQRVRNAPVLQRPGEQNPLYQRLRAAGDSIRNLAAR